ncbi:MAG: hypothetical protein HY288_13350 [Planctomycetia bacterium]|nr:hypothetical protein [Planctomycetia bacterium]
MSTIVTRLAVEELESRALLSANGLPGNSAFEGAGLPGTVAANAVSSGIAVGSFGPLAVNGLVGGIGLVNNVIVPPANTSGPDATTGVGQMTITNGANTLGIGSFATPTCGTGSMGGTGMVFAEESSVAP